MPRQPDFYCSFYCAGCDGRRAPATEGHGPGSRGGAPGALGAPSGGLGRRPTRGGESAWV
jgi:hypothetical protein